jgi:hypothetical protein
MDTVDILGGKKFIVQDILHIRTCLASLVPAHYILNKIPVTLTAQTVPPTFLPPTGKIVLSSREPLIAASLLKVLMGGTEAERERD